MPFIMRTVQEYGIQLMGISYWTDALRRFVHAPDPNARKRKKEFICRYDPRDLSKIWMFEPESDKYIEVPYRDLSRPPISYWELKDAKKQLREESMSATNEELIFKTIDQMRDIVASESAKTKSARVKQQRRKQWDASSKVSLQNKEVKKPKNPAPQPEPDDELDEFTPFEGIRES
jgi:putative transposase